MPTYEYVCSKCGHQFDVFQSMADAPLTVCPKQQCKLKTWGKGKVKRQIGAGAGLIFKGSGFYITDYRSKSYSEAARKDASAVSSSAKGKSSTAGGDSKAASTKPESKPATSKKS